MKLEFLPIFCFAAVGVANSVIDYCVFAAVYFGVAVGLVSANIIAYAVAATFSYVVNSRWTFSSRKGTGGPRGFLMFQTVNLIGLALATTALVVLAHYMPVLIAKLLAIGISFVWSFTTLDRLIWPQHRNTSRRS